MQLPQPIKLIKPRPYINPSNPIPIGWLDRFGKFYEAPHANHYDVASSILEADGYTFDPPNPLEDPEDILLFRGYVKTHFTFLGFKQYHIFYNSNLAPTDFQASIILEWLHFCNPTPNINHYLHQFLDLPSY